MSQNLFYSAMFWPNYHIMQQTITELMYRRTHLIWMTGCLPYIQIKATLFPVNLSCHLICCSLLLLSVCPSYLSVFLSLSFFFPLYLLTPLLVCVSACLCLGSDSAQKAGLQPCHVSLWLQGQYQTCPWRWQCKYCWSWSHTLVRVDAYHCYANFASFRLPCSKLWSIENLFFYPSHKRLDLSQRDKRGILMHIISLTPDWDGNRIRHTS